MLAACTYITVRATSHIVKEASEKREKKGMTLEEVEERCEKFGTEMELFPGNYNKIKIVRNLTVYQGVDYSLVYQPQYYYLNYEPARIECGTDEKALIKHFVTEGMALGVRASENFDVASYYNSSKDLREQYGPDFPQYYKHYIREGHNDKNRKVLDVTKIEDPITVYNDFDYAKVFDLDYYVENYPELKNFLTIPGPGGCIDDQKAVMHFVESGIAELRQANESYDFVSYFLLNPDLRELYKTNFLAYVIHYVNNGPDDNRPALGKHSIEEFERTVYDMRPTIEKETLSMLNYVGGTLGGAYNWCASIPYVSLPLNWSAEGYAMYAYGSWCGNCFAKASAFYYMATMLGYNARLVSGYVPLGEDQHLGPHGWVEINGAVYDPDFETETGKNGYAIYYGQPGTWQYTNYWYMA